MCVCLSCAPYWRPGLQPRQVPCLGINQTGDPYVRMLQLNPLSHTSQGKNFFKFFIVIQLQLGAFSPHPSTPPQPKLPPSPTSTLPLDLVHVSFIVVPVIPSPHCPLPTPP